MGFSTGDGFRLSNGGVLSGIFWKALALNAFVALGRAGLQEYSEDAGKVEADGMNFAVAATQNFLWRNPKDAVIFLYNAYTAPE